MVRVLLLAASLMFSTAGFSFNPDQDVDWRVLDYKEINNANGTNVGFLYIEMTNFNNMPYNKRYWNTAYVTIREANARKLHYLKVFVVPNKKLLAANFVIADAEFCVPAACKIMGLPTDATAKNMLLSKQEFSKIQIRIAEELWRLMNDSEYVYQNGEPDYDKIAQEISYLLDVSLEEINKNAIKPIVTAVDHKLVEKLDQQQKKK